MQQTGGPRDLLLLFKAKMEMRGKLPVLNWGRDLKLFSFLLRNKSYAEVVKELIQYVEEGGESVIGFYSKYKKERRKEKNG